MKYLRFIVQNLFLTFSFLILFSLNLHAGTIRNACPPGANTANVNGIYNGDVTDQGKNGPNAWDSYSISIPSDGDLSISYTSTDKTRVWFSTNNTNYCRNNRILSNGKLASHTLTVTAGQTAYIQLREMIGGGNTANYNFTLNFVPSNLPPTANAGADQSVPFGSAVTLTGSGSDSDGSITGYKWTEGATILSNTASFTKSDFTAGTHTLTLTVTDNDGATGTDTVFITVIPNSPPTANAGADQLINLGDSANLDASGSSDSDGSIVAYLWQEGTTTLSSNASFTFATPSAGIHTITLTVTDDDGDTDTDTVDIRVNTAPVAHAGPDQNITLGAPVTLDGTGSTDDFNSITYAWTESTIPLNLSGATATTTIATAGTYTITLTVTDNNGLTDTDTLTVIVNTPPVVEDMNFTILRDTSVSFELNATDDDNDTIVSYPIFTSPSHGSLSGPESNLTYTPDANYTGTDIFTYKAFDGMDYSNEGTVTIHVYPPATAVADDFNTTYNTLVSGNVLTNDLGLNIRLIDHNTTSHGALSIGTDGAFTYLPDELFDGNDTFSYTIEDDFNLTSTATATILVYPPRSDLSIIKTAPASVDSDLAIDYTLNIQSNSGEQYIVAKNVRVEDQLPPGTQYSGITAPSGWTCGQASGVVSCDAANIPLGYNDNIVIHAFAPHILGDSINNASIGSDTIDSDLSNNTSSATTNITGPDVDLSITKTVSSPTVIITDAYAYTLSVQSIGTADATGVTVTDTLDASLGFISINQGTDWVCSQGTSIICNYIANGGILTAGSTPNNITINVRAPATEANITNTASVDSAILELNTANNSASVDVNITNGLNQGGSVALSKYLQYNLYGDMKLIGNANVNYAGIDPNKPYNDNVNMRYVDTDGSGTTFGVNTFNSSSSTLSLPDPSYNIIWAGLYWEGHVCSSNNNGTGNGNGTRCDWSNSNFTSFNQASTAANMGSIKLKTPQRSNYIDITANTLDIIQRNATDWTYSAFADITNLINADETGTYTTANIVLTEGQTGNGGNYGGWSMLVIYEDDNKTLKYKNISVFNGFQRITSDNNPLQINGFLTPLSGPVTASIAFFAGDGDPVSGGVARMRQGNTNTYSPISSVTGTATSPAGNLFNSTVGEFGQAINTGVLKTYGVDADRIDVSPFMVNGQTNTEFRLDVSTPSGGVDYYTLSMFAFATDLTSPIIDKFQKRAVIIDQNGTRRVAGPNQPIYPGNLLEYTISFSNTGDETAEGVVIFDDFDFDGLSQTLNLNAFDNSSIKLFDGNNTTFQISNPDCGYDASQRRVYCNLPTVAINQQYTMQFLVTVKDNLSINDFDTNASNTAYAKYRNPNGNNYVEFYTTPSGEAVGGKSNALNSGVFSAIDRSGESYISVDAINDGYAFNIDKNITTKIVNKPFNIQLVHRDASLQNTAYQAQNGRRMLVLVTLEDNGAISPPLAVGNFYQGTYSTTVTGLKLTRAHSYDRFKMAYLDWYTILGWAPSTSACLANTKESTNLTGVPQCFNTYRFVEDVFPKASFPQIATCFGEGTALPSGKTYPCNPLAYSTGGTLVSANIYPSDYNHDYGCYQCITEGYLHFRNDSTDDFAARPDHFVFDSNSTSYPDLLRSGQDYNLSLIAKDGLDNATLDYNTTGNNFSTLAPTLNPNNDPSVTASLEGNVTLGSSGANIADGISVDTNNHLAYNVGFTFNNVGEVGITIMDPDWANTDSDDTPEDCNATTNAYGVPIEGGRGICGSLTAIFIPDHFKLTAQVQNHRNGSFTYLHTDDYSVATDPHMSAHVRLAIEAQNASDEIATNFKENAYENAITSDLNITDWNATLKTIRDNLNPRLDTNRNKKGIDTATTLGFGTSGFSDGTYTIDTDNATAYTKRLLFNYDRTENSPKNPFIIQGSEVNATLNSTYTGTAPEGTAIIKGWDIASGKATFYHARVRPARAFYPDVTAAQQNTPVLIDVYCDASDYNFTRCNNADIDIDTALGEFAGNGLKWWLALKHDMSQNDGNVTLKVTGTGGLNRTLLNITPTSNAKDNNIIVTPPNANRPVTVQIDLDTTTKTDTSEWLYDDSLIVSPSPFEEVEFIGISNWTGHGDTGNVVGGVDANKNKNKRLGW